MSLLFMAALMTADPAPVIAPWDTEARLSALEVKVAALEAKQSAKATAPGACPCGPNCPCCAACQAAAPTSYFTGGMYGYWQWSDGRQEQMGQNGEHTGIFFGPKANAASTSSTTVRHADGSLWTRTCGPDGCRETPAVSAYNQTAGYTAVPCATCPGGVTYVASDGSGGGCASGQCGAQGAGGCGSQSSGAGGKSGCHLFGKKKR